MARRCMLLTPDVQPQIMKRREAKALGLTRYFTGKPCKHGHGSERFVSGQCVECKYEWVKAHPDWKRGVTKKWRLNNPDKVRVMRAARYRRNREKIREAQRKYQQSHRAEINLYMAQWKMEHPEQYKTYSRLA